MKVILKTIAGVLAFFGAVAGLAWLATTHPVLCLIVVAVASGGAVGYDLYGFFKDKTKM